MKICAFGELLIDVAPYGVSDRHFPVYEFNPGGAPANVAVAVSNLGYGSSFIGQVGNDYFGLFLKQTLDDKKVDTEGLLLSNQYPTSLAIVSLSDQGERSFSFYRNPFKNEGISIVYRTKKEWTDLQKPTERKFY